MKKGLLFIFMAIIMANIVYAQRDTIAGWTFPTGVDTVDIYTNMGIADNEGRYISAEDTTEWPNTVQRDVYCTNGVSSGDYAATAVGWDGGANAKLWSIKFKANGYESLQVSSKQRSGGSNAGPKYWKIQYRLSGEEWADVNAGEINVANDWTTGVISELDLPADLDNPGTTSIYIRWIMVSDSSISQTLVDVNGTSKIDDIIITGVPVQTNPVDLGDTIAGWTFPTGVDTVDIYANAGIALNDGRYISAEDTTEWPNTVLRDVYFTNGASDYAATAVGWEDGKDAKLWSIKFKAEGYTDLKVSSKISSGGNSPGPRDWKMQIRYSGEDWIDIPGGTVTAANDWTTGVVEGLPFPAGFENPGSSSMYIRWIMTSDTSITNDLVLSDGISKIDDVVISGTSTAGVETVVYSSNLKVYPNPVDEYLTLDSKKNIVSATIIDINGRIIKTEDFNSNLGHFNLSDLQSGVYFVRVKLSDVNTPEVHKIIVK